MAMTRPQPLADHTSIIKRTAENFPKTALASIQLMCLIAKTNQVCTLNTLPIAKILRVKNARAIVSYLKKKN